MERQEFHFNEGLGNIFYNSIRKADDTLDSSPVDVSLVVGRTTISRCYVPNGGRSNPDRSVGSVRNNTLPLDDLEDPEKQLELCTVLSQYMAFEPTYFDGSQPYVYTEDPPFIRATDKLDSIVVGVTPNKARKGKKKAEAGSVQLESVLVHASVQRAFPLSSSHQGRPFRLACVLCIPARDSENARMLVAFSRPFKVLAKQGPHGSKPKLIHPSRFERVPFHREAILRAILASAATVQEELVPQDKTQLEGSAATVDAGTISCGLEGAGSGGPADRIEHPSDSSLPVPIPAALRRMEAALRISVVGAPGNVPATESKAGHFSAGGHSAGQPTSGRAPRPKRPLATPRSSAVSGGSSSEEGGFGAGAASPAVKRPRRSAAVAASEKISRSLTVKGVAGRRPKREEEEEVGSDPDKDQDSGNEGGPLIGQGRREGRPPSSLPPLLPPAYSPRGIAHTLGKISNTAASQAHAGSSPRRTSSPGSIHRAGRAGVGTPRDDDEQEGEEDDKMGVSSEGIEKGARRRGAGASTSAAAAMEMAPPLGQGANGNSSTASLSTMVHADPCRLLTTPPPPGLPSDGSPHIGVMESNLTAFLVPFPPLPWASTKTLQASMQAAMTGTGPGRETDMPQLKPVVYPQWRDKAGAQH